ncbi:RluA family pseudouridine synthase [Desulfogranum japonicum]|uniref:RluA family pseudouridine synthase n=1 Tax=Desulfogranum japonicum TaxID=231447 RepID=UPI000424D65B|nr:RNA pseudouridine synthase [Desulfogranum japonicum]
MDCCSQIVSQKGDTIPILYEDNHLLVVNKAAGILVQEDATGDQDILTLAKQYIKKKYKKPGNVYLGLVHRLDRPVSGVIVLARTSKAARRLSEQIRERKVGKHYIGLVEGRLPAKGMWIDNIRRKGKHAWIDPAGKKAVLEFSVGKIFQKKITQVNIDLKTGRHHQIRLQFSHRGYPLLGDYRYGSKIRVPGGNIALHAKALTIEHPTRACAMTFFCEPQPWWRCFSD